MGGLRLLLALAVMFEHMSNANAPFLWFGGRIAVIIFFMISGFYMTLIYTTKYSKLKDGTFLFYSNRALRLYPVYWFLLCMIIVVNISSKNAPPLFLFDPEYWHFPGFFITLANIFMFGCDAIKIADPSFLLVNPIWSLGSEVLFYLMVPFVVTRPFVAIVLLVGSFLTRAYFTANGYVEYPFLAEFFPSLLGYFLMGNLGFYIYMKAKDYAISKYIGVGSIIFFFAYITYKIYKYEGFFLAFFDPNLGAFKAYLLFVAFALVIPFLFLATKDSKIDRFIGNLSYSLYIFHIFIIGQVHMFLSPFLGVESGSLGFVTVIIAILFSICVYLIIERPIEGFRQKRIEM